MSNGRKKIGLVLTGGGARAAYQIGCLRAIAEITKFEENPFEIISGFSAGAINGVWLASRSDDFQSATKAMWDAWANIKASQVFRTDSASLLRIGVQWLKSRTIGSLDPKHQINYLLDTAPLGDLLEKEINFDQIEQNIRNGKLHGLSIVAANYQSGKSTAFFCGNCDIKNWEGPNRVSVRSELSTEHIMASSAIPIFFRPIKIGDHFYGDGMIRLSSPLSPAIHMGADKLIIIGVRAAAKNEEKNSNGTTHVTLSEIAGTILNGLFFDSLENDISRLEKVNHSLAALKRDEFSFDKGGIKQIPYVSMKPSQSLATTPSCELAKFPFALRFLLRGLGVSHNKGSDLMSYLSFEASYTSSLLQEGFNDTMARREEIEKFFEI